MRLDEVVETALQRRPEFSLSQARQAVADRVAERTDSLLAGESSINFRHKSDALGSNDGLREWAAGVAVPLWLPGQRNSYRQLAQGLGAEAEAGHKLLAWEVAGEVRERAWALRLAQSNRDQAETQLAATQALEREVKRRFEAGELANADWVLARQETLTRQSLLQQAEASLEIAVNAWQAYTGLTLLPEPLAEQTARNDAFPASHPLLLNAAGKVEVSRAERSRQRIERRANPNLGLSANRERPNDQTDYDDYLELTLAIPLGGGRHAGPDLARAEANLTEAEAALRKTQYELEHDLEQARLTLEQTTSAINLAQQSKDLTAQSEHLAKRAFELGESDLASLLRARNRAADAALELERKRIEHQRAIARYNQILGVMPQ
ncbi:MAG: TolC family protein [Chromatiales bacterium]|jgi:outer membrane protein TolC